MSCSKPTPGADTSLATSRSSPFETSFVVACAHEVVGLCREPHQRLVRAPATSQLGEDVDRRAELDHRHSVALLELVAGGLHRSEVGHRRSHDHDLGVRRQTSHRLVHLCSGGDLDPLDRCGDEVSVVVVTSVTDAPRSTAASAMAWPCLPDERLPMKRTGSIGSRVPPAVTSTCRPCIDRGVPDVVSSSVAAATMSTGSASRPAPTSPPARRPSVGSTTWTPRDRRSDEVVLHRRVLPHLGVHGGADHHRRPGGQQHVGQQIVGVPRRVGRQQLRGGRRHQDQVGLLAQGRVRDGVVIVPQGCGARVRRPARSA